MILAFVSFICSVPVTVLVHTIGVCHFKNWERKKKIIKASFKKNVKWRNLVCNTIMIFKNFILGVDIQLHINKTA